MILKSSGRWANRICLDLENLLHAACSARCWWSISEQNGQRLCSFNRAIDETNLKASAGDKRWLSKHKNKHIINPGWITMEEMTNARIENNTGACLENEPPS